MGLEATYCMTKLRLGLNGVIQKVAQDIRGRNKVAGGHGVGTVNPYW
jgi:hypothetical protein